MYTYMQDRRLGCFSFARLAFQLLVLYSGCFVSNAKIRHETRFIVCTEESYSTVADQKNLFTKFSSSVGIMMLRSNMHRFNQGR